MIEVLAGLGLPRLPEGHRLRAILSKKTASNGTAERPRSHSYWPAQHYGLQRTRAFRQASAAEREAILDGCGRLLLEEAYFIEKVGIAYGAKMALLAESLDERMLYGLITADEVTHLEAISGFLRDEPTTGDNPFLALLSELVEEGDRTSLQFLIQVVLEGWGLSHYRSLAEDCQSDALQERLLDIVADEAAHHGSGVVLFSEASEVNQDFLVPALVRFLQMVAAGPQGVVSVVEQVRGRLDRPARLQLFEELEGETHSQERLALLRRLMLKVAPARPVVAQLDACEAFVAWPARSCA